jgi:hypothetical protein
MHHYTHGLGITRLPNLALPVLGPPSRHALFKLADALLTAGTVPWPVHLNLVSAHRHGWGSLYAALSRGRIEERPLCELLARRACAGGASRAPVYAVDVSV